MTNMPSVEWSAKKCPRAAQTAEGVADPVKGDDVFHSTYRRRLAVRAWLRLQRWTERRLCGAYDRLVDAEAPKA